MPSDDGEPADGRREVLSSGTINIAPSPELGAPFDPIRHRAETARLLAIGLLLIFAASMLAAIGMSANNASAGVDLAKELGPITGGPLAVALGYYFGASSK